MNARSALALSTLLIVPFAGCDGGGDDEGTSKLAPDIELFEASPPTVEADQSTTLRYRVKDAASVKIDIMDGANVLPTTPTTEGEVSTPNLADTTTFVLSATGFTGKTAMASLTVLVQKDGDAPQIVMFSANPTAVDAGMPTTLSWTIENATSARVESGGSTLFTAPMDQVANGTFQHMPAQSSTYTLVALNAAGMEARMNVMVTVNGAMPVVRSFRASPPTIDPGMSSELSWEVTNATMVVITDDVGTEFYNGPNLTGMQMVTPAATTRYTLTASDGVNNATQSVVVSVNAIAGATIVSFTATPNPVFAGQESTLEWEVQDAPDGIEIRINGALLVASPLATGTTMVMPTVTTTYELRALNPAGNATRMVTVTVNVPNAPVILEFAATPNPVGAGAMTTLSWRTLVSTSVRVLDGPTELLNTTTMVAQGTLQVTPAADTRYTLEASDGTQTTRMILWVYAHPAPTITTFTVTPIDIQGPTPVTINWNVSDYATLTLTQDGAPAPGFNVPTSTAAVIDNQGTLMITVAQPTLFVLTAVSAGGMRTAQVQVGQPVLGAESEPNNDLMNADPFPQGGTITGTLAPAGDVDWFQIMVPQDGSVRAQTSDGNNGCATDTYIYLLDSAGTIVTEDDDGGDDVGGAPGQGACSLIDPTTNAAARDLAAGIYYIRVEHYDPVNGTGGYVLNVRIDGPACGNTVVEGNEQCDFGDLANGDGCSSTCMLEINPTIISGTGGMVNVSFNGPNDIAVVRVDVANGQAIGAVAADVGANTCNTIDTAMNLGDATFNLVGGKADGGPTGTAGDCAAILYPDDAFATDLAAGSYYLVIFNQGTTTGQVQVTVTIQNSVCGNNVFETRTEQCDDGNLVAGDLCDANCDLETVGVVTIPAANPVTVQGALAAPTFADLIRIDVTTEVYLTVQTFAPNQAGGCGGGVDTVVDLYNQQLNFLGGNDEAVATDSCAAFDERWAFSRIAPGTYYLLVYDFEQNDAIPAYEVVISSIALPATPPILELEPNDTQAAATSSGLTGVGTVSVHGDLIPVEQTQGDDDVFSFVVPAGQTRMVSVRTYDELGMPAACTPSLGFNDTRIFLEEAGTEALDPNNGELAYNDDRDPAANLWCSQILPTSVTAGATDTTFFVRVQGYNDAAELHYYFMEISVQ